MNQKTDRGAPLPAVLFFSSAPSSLPSTEFFFFVFFLRYGLFFLGCFGFAPVQRFRFVFVKRSVGVEPSALWFSLVYRVLLFFFTEFGSVCVCVCDSGFDGIYRVDFSTGFSSCLDGAVAFDSIHFFFASMAFIGAIEFEGENRGTLVKVAIRSKMATVSR